MGRLLCSQFSEPLAALHCQHGPQHGQDSALFRAELKTILWPRPASDQILTSNFRHAIDSEATRQWNATCLCLPTHGPNPNKPEITSEQAYTQLCSIRQPLWALAFLIDTWFHERAPMPDKPPCLALDLLPMEVWELIAAEVAAVEPYGFEGPSVVAPAILKRQLLSKNFAALAQVCWADCSRRASRIIEAAKLGAMFAMRSLSFTCAPAIPAARRDVRTIKRATGAKLPKPIVGEAGLTSQTANKEKDTDHHTDSADGHGILHLAYGSGLSIQIAQQRATYTFSKRSKIVVKS